MYSTDVFFKNATCCYETFRTTSVIKILLANHITTKTLVRSQFARCARALKPINMAQNPESCRRLFDVILKKLISNKHFTLSVWDECQQEYALFLSTKVKDKKSRFQRFDIDNNRLDVFFMTYLQDDVRFRTITKVVKFILPMPKRL